MSISTLVSFIIGLGLIIGSIFIATDTPQSFYETSSILIVFGGTFAALYISYDFKTATNSLKLLVRTLFRGGNTDGSLKYEVAQLVDWSYILQKSGLQGLESEITYEVRQEDEFLAYGADLVITGYTGPEIRHILQQTLNTQIDRNNQKIEALKKMGGDAPAFGMLGTLIGLIIMLGNMSENPAAIGPSMAIALVTTFYGVLAARLLFIPLATKIETIYNFETFKNTLQMEGLVLLAERKSPRYIQDRINSFVDIKDQFSIDSSAPIYSEPEANQ